MQGTDDAWFNSARCQAGFKRVSARSANPFFAHGAVLDRLQCEGADSGRPVPGGLLAPAARHRLFSAHSHRGPALFRSCSHDVLRPAPCSRQGEELVLQRHSASIAQGNEICRPHGIYVNTMGCRQPRKDGKRAKRGRTRCSAEIATQGPAEKRAMTGIAVFRYFHIEWRKCESSEQRFRRRTGRSSLPRLHRPAINRRSPSGKDSFPPVPRSRTRRRTWRADIRCEENQE